jgi:thiol-disulfide isomerase/thioredoxin
MIRVLVNPFIAESTSTMMKSFCKHILVLVVVCSTTAPVWADEPKAPPVRPAMTAGRESADVTAAIQESWPDHPEWVDMLADILESKPMGPDYGWFRTAVTQTRFDWGWARKRFDKSGDGRIERQEFTGGDREFARLDRDRDGRLTAVDFDFSASALSPTPGAMVFDRVDTDGNGKVTREEIDAFFKACDSGSQGFLSLADLNEGFAPPPPRRTSGGSGRPSKAMLVRGLFRQEIGSLQPGPKLGESAPDFRLKTNDGAAELTLSKLVGAKPVVLVFGNFTCGPFRSHSGNLEKLYRQYNDRATFVMVYVREAHPTDGWRMESNDRVDVATPQPRTYGERVEVARMCARSLGLGFPMLVDTIDDAVGAQYSGMPGRLYLIDGEGKVAFKSGRGPFFFKPAELEQSLILLLQEQGGKGIQTSAATPSGGQPRRESPVAASQPLNRPAN